MTWWLWALASIPVLITVMVPLSLWRSRVKKRLILSLLADGSEHTGMELRDAGAGGLVYSYLYELEEEGLVSRRAGLSCSADGGGRPLFFYELSPLGLSLGQQAPSASISKCSKT